MTGDTGNGVDFTVSRNATFLPRETRSLCPVCRTVVSALLEERGGRVLMSKSCPEHGHFETIVSSDPSHYTDAARYERQGKEPLLRLSTSNRGCPHDCGLCDAHRQHTCVGVIEVTSVCDLDCPVCFADSSNGEHVPLATVKAMVDTLVECEGEVEVLQISGGEPTTHPDLLEIVRYAGEAGVRYPMVNTNGIRLADPEFARALAETVPTGSSAVGLPVVYLQFDGVTDEVYQVLRGEPLMDIKMRAIENCRDNGMSVVLVPTLVRGVNDHKIGEIVEMALKDPTIKGVNFQPAAMVGRYEVTGSDPMTIPEVMKALETQTEGTVGRDSFVSVPCPHPACSVASYVYDDGQVTATLLDLVDTDLFMKHMADQAVPFGQMVSETIESAADVLDMADMVGEEIVGLACCPTGIRVPPVRELIDRVTLVTVHAFMDPTNFDVERASKCCVTEVLPDGRMVPFCVYNNLHRGGGC